MMMVCIIPPFRSVLAENTDVGRGGNSGVVSLFIFPLASMLILLGLLFALALAFELEFALTL